MRTFRQAASWLAATLIAASAGPAAAAKLPALGGDPARVSVSGLSSGGFMALQYAVAFSASTVGVGVVSGGPYDCASVTPGGINGCMQGAPRGADSLSAAQAFARIGQVDPVAGLKSQKVYLYRGTHDPIVSRATMDAVRDFFALAGAPPRNVQYVNALPAGHAFVSVNFGAACDHSETPFVDRCAKDGAPYDQPGAILAQIYGPLKPRAAALSAAPVAFGQGEFAGGLAGLAKTGFVYVPAACARTAARCAVHVVFHGCGQSAKLAKDAVYGRVGYNEWAEANGIIVLYPQVDPSFFLPLNPEGCWDWWGATGLNFMTKSGPQAAAVHAMVARLVAPRR